VQPPRLAHDPVNRRGLRARLRESDACLALVVAPAGYGKTTLLAQWALDDPRPVGWIALTESDNDPPALLAHFLLALEAACAVDDEQYRAIALSPADIASVVLPRFGAVVGDAPPMIWMLDDTHLLSSARSLEVLRVLCEHLSPGSAIVLSGRRAPDVPIARWRASRWVLDVGYDDLTMTPTEGWPAGIYLSALTDRFDLDVDPVSASDGDGAIAAYLSEEVLRAFDDSDTDFLLRSAVLDDLTPATCDAVLGTVDAGARLDRFAATNSFVRRVGPDVYRYHRPRRGHGLA
jgi:LuxR family maltose regulon positive regulatory protein